MKCGSCLSYCGTIFTELWSKNGEFHTSGNTVFGMIYQNVADELTKDIFLVHVINFIDSLIVWFGFFILFYFI